MKKMAIRTILSVLEWPLRRRQQRLMATRATYTKEDFTRLCFARDASQKIIDEVWAALRDEAVVEDFKPHPEDHIERDFGLADEDRDEDVILALLHRCGCRVASTEEVLSMRPVDTVGDLVDFLAKLKSPSPSSG